MPALILLVSCTPKSGSPIDARGPSHSATQGTPATPLPNAANASADAPAIASDPARSLPSESPNGGAQFTDVTRAAGIFHTHHRPVLDHRLDNIMPWVASVGAAVAAADFDRDGWIDLFVTDSAKGTPNHLYRNNKDGTFTDVARKAGVSDLNDDRGTAMDAVWGDYDNDGWPDLFIVRWGEDILLRNNSDGTFSDVTSKLFRRRDGSVGMQWANGCAAIWLDFNLDGRLDLYVGNYFAEHDLWHLTTTRIMHDDFEQARNGGPNFMFRQNADGTFTEVAGAMGLDDTGWTLAVGSADINNDAWPDLYCADDFGSDQLFLNNRDGTFRNVSDSAIGPDTRKGMNVDFGDINNDGWLDVTVSNITTAEYLQEGNMLWYNNGVEPGGEGNLTLTDISLEAGAYDGGWGWGGKFFDYDLDGDLDLFAVNGFISAGEGSYWYDLASWTVLGQDAGEAKNWPVIGHRSFSGYEKDRLWRNDGNLLFTERAAEVGLASDRDGRGVACIDYDNDGDLDVFIANQNQPPCLYRNNLARSTSSHWLAVQLEGDPATGDNRDAVGARVTVVSPSGSQIRERDGGNGYSGQSDPRLFFGLGAESLVTLLEVRWPDGGLQYLENIPANKFVRIRQSPEHYGTRMTVSNGLPRPIRMARTSDESPSPRLQPEDLNRVLGEFESEIRAHPMSHRAASRYRAACDRNDQYDRPISFLKGMIAARTDTVETRIQLACAYVDKIKTCGGLAAIVSKGTLARKALDQLDIVIKENPERWEAFYCRAQNHLHWPRALLHSKDSIADFRRCIEIQRRGGAESVTPHFARTYIGLGDAHTKNLDYAAARAVWHEGLERFPGNKELQERLTLTDDGKLLRYVEDQRSLEHAIDTDLSFLETGSE